MSLVRDFGAVGDGKADDTRALQHAVEDGDGVLELGKGSFRITKPIELDTTKHGYCGLRGSQGTARIIMDGRGPALKIIGDHGGTATPSSVEDHTWNDERMPIISEVEILGKHREADGIQLVRTMQATITNVLIRRCRVGVRLGERNRNFLLSASHIYDCSDTGVYFDNCNLHQVIITGNHISYCKRAGIRQFNGDVHNIQITGNDIEYNSGADGTSGEIVLEAPDGIISEFTISGNTLQATLDAMGANVLILGRDETSPTAVRLINITGNVLGSRKKNIVIEHGSKCSITGNTIYGGTDLNVALTNCEGVVVGSNTIGTRPASYRSDSADGMLLSECVGCSVVGNVVADSQLGDAAAGGAVSIVNSRQVDVSSCQILNPHVRGIDVVNSSLCRISDNSVTEDPDRRSMLQAIRVSVGGENNIVQNNVVTRSRKSPIDCHALRGKTAGNTIWN